MFRRFTVLIATTLAACGQGEPSFRAQVERATDELVPEVERLAGLEFREPPIVEIRTSEQVGEYIARRVGEDLPPDVMEHVAEAYRLFGLIPDTLDLPSLFEELLREQVAGFFDPDSNALFLIDDTDPTLLTFTLSHELVHALQDQYVDLAGLLDPALPNDRSTAAQAVMEGQATWIGLRVMVSDENLAVLGDFEDVVRDAIDQQRSALPVFTSAPLVIRETLLFPYVKGASFMRWFSQQFPDTVPFGPRLPTSTEQLLHRDRYIAGDQPVPLRFGDDPRLAFQDGLGEFETSLLLWELSESSSVGRAGALGWDGDQYAVLDLGDDRRALVWWSVWDSPEQAERFGALLERYWHRRDGREVRVRLASIADQAAVQVIDAPAGWTGWNDVPSIDARSP